MRIERCDDTHCMRFVPIIKMVFSLIIVSLLVVYAFSQSANRWSAKGQEETFQTPVRRPITRYMHTKIPRVSVPNIAPSYGDSVAQKESVSENFDSSQYLYTPDPSITPSFFKKSSSSTENSITKEKLPKITPSSVQNPKMQSLLMVDKPLPLLTAYREVAPDSTQVNNRMKADEKMPSMKMKEDESHMELFPSAIPTPKEAYVNDEEKKFQSREGEKKPDYRVEQKPEYAPFENPFLLAKKKEDEPEIPPYEDISSDEGAVVSVEKEESVKEEVTQQNFWSIAAVEDKYPLQEGKLQGEKEQAVVTQPEAVSVELPKQTVSIKTALADGAFIQLASYTKQNDAKYAASSEKLFTKMNNVFVYKRLSSQYYKLVAGPFKKDNVGVQLLNFNRKGFSDAFVLKRR